MHSPLRHSFTLIALACAIGTLSLAIGAKAQPPDKPGSPPTAPLEQARGTLPLPVAGEQIVAFGQPTKDGPSKGVVIRTDPGAQVVAPCDGMLVYVGEFRNYGNLVIISAGNGYHFLLSSLSLVSGEVGQSVHAGEPIGTLPRSTADGAAPTLRVELRKDQRPVDPAPWWRKS